MKILAVVFAGYVGVVGLFETALGILQPHPGSTMVLVTFDRDGTPHERVVARLESGGKLYAAANHWPRAWYRRVLRNPRVLVRYQGETREYRAVAVSGEEAARVDREHPLPLPFRFVTGFPPRRFVRLDPA